MQEIIQPEMLVRVLVFGDFNIHPKENNDYYGNLNSRMAADGFAQIIDKPTPTILEIRLGCMPAFNKSATRSLLTSCSLKTRPEFFLTRPMLDFRLRECQTDIFSCQATLRYILSVLKNIGKY